MANHSSILVWKIPWTEGPGGLQSIESQRVRHNWCNLACTCTELHHAYLFTDFSKMKIPAVSCFLKVYIKEIYKIAQGWS